MADLENAVEHLYDCLAASKPENMWVFVRKTIVGDALALLKEQEAVVRCEDCENWTPGYITDHDDFIPPKCGKYQQMVGHSATDYCSLAARKESR